MSTIAILVLVGVASAVLIARLLWPRAQRKAGPETNWEQGNDERYPSMEGSTEDTSENVEKGYDIAFRGRGN